MRKAIRWQLFFAESKPESQNPKHYRVDIYDEQDGSWSGITELTAGDTPFTTEEDASDDFFAPIRTQTGTLQVCTLLPGTTDQYITLDELLPANNIARPVQLINLDSTPNTIEWQGFLSCEAYSQDYTGIPQNIDLPLNGVLEAMDSVDVNPNTLSGMMHVFEIVYNTFHEIEQQSGMSLFDYIFYPKTDWRIFTKHIDATAFFKQNEYNNENSTTYIVSGQSCKEVLEKIATYMGWIVREHKTWLYFQRVGEDLGMYRQRALDFVAAFHSAGHYLSRPLVTKALATDADWMGTGHQRSIAAGAKSVEVVAKLDRFDLKLSLPECPVGDLQQIYSQLWEPHFIGYGPSGQPVYSTGSEWMFLLGNKNTTAYSSIILNYYSALYKYSVDIYDPHSIFSGYQSSNVQNLLNNVSIQRNSPAKRIIDTSAISDIRYYAGAFLARYCWEDDDQAVTHDTKNALYCTFFPQSLVYPGGNSGTNFDPTQVSPIFTMNSGLKYTCSGGWLRLQTKADIIYEDESTEYIGNVLRHSDDLDRYNLVAFELQFGNLWWNGTEWVPQQSRFNAVFNKGNFQKSWTSEYPIEETDGTLIPLPNYINGEITLKIWPMASGTNYRPGMSTVYEMVFQSLDVDYVNIEDDTLTDRTENKYFRLLGTNFRDEISIDAELASMLDNQPSPSLIMNDVNDPMKVLDYSISAENPNTTESRRPEVDLLNRLASYYSASRQKLELDVAHIETPALPLIKLQGISPDNRVYLPLSESRDWQTDVCKLTCFETPQEPSES